MKIVILAGGKGKRLAPYTMVLPKPLMPVGGYPILEILIRQLKQCGLKDITLAVGHLGELIQTFFGDGKRLQVRIKYVFENKPLGTAGPLASIRGLDKTFLVMNGDLLTTLNFSRLLKYHKKNRSIATIATHRESVKVDYGVIKYNQEKRLVDYIEKPTLPYSVSMGVYVFEPEVLKYIKRGRRLDFPDLVKILLKEKKKVLAYESEDLWLDIGRQKDYELAIEQFEKLRKKFFNFK